MGGPTGRGKHRTATVLLRFGAAVAVAFVVVALALPLIARGPVARWLVARASSSICGTIRLGGARIGWPAVFEVLLGRPFRVAVEDLEIKGPDGQVVLAAAHLDAAIVLHRRDAIEVTWLRVAQGRWRLDLDSDGAGTMDAFRTVPLAGRSACLDPQAVRRARGAKRGGGGSVALRRIELAGVDAELTFDSWGMTLAGADAVGSLSAGGDPPFLFDVHDVVARSGSVRIGGPRSPWRMRVPMDAVAIARVGVLPDAPTDLMLDVTRGVTGRALLSGRAAFRNIFPGPGGRPPTEPAGLEAEVRWTSFGGALERLEAAWRPTGVWLGHVDGDMHGVVRGPFSDLEGLLQIEGKRTKVTARLAHGQADLRLTLGGVDTSWMLDPALRPLLGGDLHGRFHATARLAPTLAGIDAQIPDADLRLERRRAPRGPLRYELRIGAAARKPDTAEALSAAIGRIRLADAVLHLDGVRLNWTGLSAALDAEVVFPAQTADGDRTRSRVDAQGRLDVAALEDWIPAKIVSGPLRVEASARGTIERVDLKLGFPPPSALAVKGQRFRLPRRLDAQVSDAGVRFSPFELQRAGGGTIRLAGRVGDRLALSVGLSDFPLAAARLIDGADLPDLAGLASADLTLSGPTERPAIAGKLTVAGLAVAHKPIGDVAADLRLGNESGDLTATVDRNVTVHARVKRRSGLSIDADAELRDRPLGPWLPSRLAGAPLTTSGRVSLAFRSGTPMKADAELTVAGPGLTDVRVTGRLRGSDVGGHVAGTLDVARWPQLWPHLLKSATGVLDLDVGVEDVMVRPRGSGTLRVSRDLVVVTGAWPAPLTLAAGGRFTLDGTQLTLSDVALHTSGLSARLSGRATPDLDELDRTALALRLDGELDAARFPLKLPSGASLGGRVALQVQVGGTLAGLPGPRLDGSAQLEGVTVRLSPSTPMARGQGVVEAHGNVVRTRGVDVDVDGVGVVRVGGPEAPAFATVVSLSPFRLGEIDVPFSGKDLTVGAPGSQLYLPDLDASLRLTGDVRSALVLAGEASVSGGVLDPSKRSKSPAKPPAASGTPAPTKPRVGGAWWRALPPRLTLNLDLRGTNKGIRVEVPVLPDVSVDFRCHLHATNRGATWSGRLRGNNVYARAAVTIYDWFQPEDLRGCQFTK